MRVVERTKNTQSVAYLVSRWLGKFAMVFSIVVCLLMIFNNLRVKSADPIHVAALDAMVEELANDPKDLELRKRIEELDHLARMAFFSSQSFNRISVWLLFGGLLTMVACYKLQGFYHQEDPLPDGTDRKDDLIKDATFGRWAIGGAGLMLAGFTLILALSTETKLGKAQAGGVLPDGPTLALASPDDFGKNWPYFRGYNGDGIARLDAPPPVKWDGAANTNIKWKTPIAKTGFNTPIYWGGKVFLSGGDKAGQEVYAIDAESGKVLWTSPVAAPAGEIKVSGDTGYAASGMATNGTLVYAIFATGTIVGLDFEGKEVWKRDLGIPKNAYGHASSLVVFEDLVLVQLDHEDGGKLFGLDAATGAVRWETPRNLGPSWSSPLLANTGRWELILCASPVVASYDPKTGKELWRADVLGGEVAPMASYADGLLYVAADYVKVAALDIKTHQIAWESESDIPGVSSPLIVNGLMFLGLSDGGIVCRDAKTGADIWFQETVDGFYASPILAGGNVYLMDRGGTMHIFTAHREWTPVGTNKIDEQAVASPIFVGNSIYYRAMNNLYKIGMGS